MIPPANPHHIGPWTHFIWMGTYAHGFSLDTCEQCGKQVEAANSIQIHERRERLLREFRMIEVPEAERLDEMGYCDALDGCACPDCFVEEPEPDHEPRRERPDSPGLVRTGADRDREMSYEDYRELTRPEEPPGDNEDI